MTKLHNSYYILFILEYHGRHLSKICSLWFKNSLRVVLHFIHPDNKREVKLMREQLVKQDHLVPADLCDIQRTLDL